MKRVLCNATDAAAMLGYEVSTFNRKIRLGEIPAAIEHKATLGQGRDRRFSVLLIELWAAGVDIERLDIDDKVLRAILAREVERR